MAMPAGESGVSQGTNSAVTIREFQPGDEETFRKLNEEWITRHFRLEESDYYLFDHLQEAILEPGGKIFFAVVDGRCVGCCALVRMGDTEFEISKMGVTAACQGMGAGRLLLRAAVESGRALGATRLYLETNHALDAAQRLYASQGFKRIDPSRIKPSPYARADVFMELMLD
ncbi:MAG: GNAT family N-acetyltransferase [Terracidiphilus sp.]|jgi:ribosomal protein S18 acetylase RimI-like enzyme